MSWDVEWLYEELPLDDEIPIEDELINPFC